MTIRVFLVDDHVLVRTGMKMILGGEVDIEVVGEADSGEDALPMIRKLKPDVVLCDLHLPGVSGLEVTERVVKGDHGTRVIVVSVLEDGPMPKRLLEAGASGYVGKGGDSAFDRPLPSSPFYWGNPWFVPHAINWLSRHDR